MSFIIYNTFSSFPKFSLFSICTAADQYFIVIFLPAQPQINIFSSISYLRSGRLIFYRHSLICTAAGQYSFVKQLSAKLQVNIFPSFSYLHSRRSKFYRLIIFPTFPRFRNMEFYFYNKKQTFNTIIEQASIG